MKRLSQRCFAAIAAVLGLGGMATAQYGAPNPLPAIPIPPAQTAQYVPFQPIVEAPRQSVQQVQSIQAAPVAQQPTSVATVGGSVGAGCSNCGDSTKRPGSSSYLPKNATLGAGLAPVPYAEYCSECANGCGSLKSNIGFYLGSCKSFFNPCGPVPCNIWGNPSACRGGGCQHCGVHPYAKPYGTGYNTCVYDSYLNH